MEKSVAGCLHLFSALGLCLLHGLGHLAKEHRRPRAVLDYGRVDPESFRMRQAGRAGSRRRRQVSVIAAARRHSVLKLEASYTQS